jgi:hypothetical protein
MTKRILYQKQDGQLVIICPAPNSGISIEQVALKDVPPGLPYKIVDVEDIPTDRTFRNAWQVDEAALTDGVGADYGVGSNNTVVGWRADGTPIIGGIA